MRYSSVRPVPLALALTGFAVTSACAQSLERKVASAAGSSVQFHFSARPGICGDGRTYLRYDTDSWIGSINDVTRSLPCETGPVRVVVTKSGAEAIRVETFVGPLANVTTGGEVTDVGRVPAGEAVAYLSTLATRGEGRVARDALLPLGVADSATVTPVLLTLARDADRPRDSRRSALTWLVRRRTTNDAMPAKELVTLLAGIAGSDSEHASLRQSVIGMLARLDDPEGIATLIRMSRSDNDPWLSKQSTETLARSGDPRARRAVRELAQNANASAEVRAVAMTGMASEYGSASDAEALIAMYPSLTTDRLRDAAISGVAGVGGVAARKFLLGMVKDETQPARQRRKAASLLDRVGVPVRDVVGAYDGVSDGEVRVQLIELLAQSATREATTKLVAIAKGDTQPSARRRAIAVLGRSEDAAVREALRGIVNQ